MPGAGKTVLVTGASGLVGAALCPVLESRGHRVRRLTRGTGANEWDPARGHLGAEVLDGIDAVIHLAGENVAQRWTATVRRAILMSFSCNKLTMAWSLRGLAGSSSSINWAIISCTDLLETASPVADL